jgi:hypothetical protein
MDVLEGSYEADGSKPKGYVTADIQITEPLDRPSADADIPEEAVRQGRGLRL